VYTSMSSDGYDCAVRIFPYKSGESLPTTAAQPVMPPAAAPRVMLCNGIGMTFFLTCPEKASCKIYSLNGRLLANLTPLVRAMNAGRATLPFSSLRAVSGACIVALDNGSAMTVRSLILTK
jgi:hypothetical protein